MSRAAGLKKVFGERYLYAGLGTTLALGAMPHAVGASGWTTPRGLSHDDVQHYHALLVASSERRQGLFANLARSSSGGAYLAAQWRRSMVGCC